MERAESVSITDEVEVGEDTKRKTFSINLK